MVINQSVEDEQRCAVAIDPLSRAFVALADPTRRDIVARLSTRDATVGELAESYAISMQAVSKHLKVLEEAGLVSRSRDAQRRPCHLEPQVFDLMTSWIERYRRQAEDRFSRLDAVLAAVNTSAPGAHPDTGPEPGTDPEPGAGTGTDAEPDLRTPPRQVRTPDRDTRPEPGKPDPGKPDPGKPEPSRREPDNPRAEQNEGARHDPHRP
ncbi:metalloregulator ArsR/SmtB family transcription factor [Kitasatospora sp. NPDC048194]|uniref:ArsR/SmtB family transcription factor n=1 Tax=Kitasatospora sp. NPDC048194 TaxID=3364045 RepID=UPI0037171EDA